MNGMIVKGLLGIYKNKLKNNYARYNNVQR